MKIQLPPFVLADLYKESLVIVDDVLTSHENIDETKPHQSIVETEPQPASFLGQNGKGIAVLVNDKQHRFTDVESLQLLTNMLGALHMTMDDIALINTDKTKTDYKQMQSALQTRICLMFDVSTQSIGLPFQMPDYKVQTFDNCRFLCSASLQKMRGSGKEAKLEKTKLWMCLKSLFEKDI